MYGRDFNSPGRSTGTHRKPYPAFADRQVSTAELIKGLGSKIEGIRLPPPATSHSKPVSIRDVEAVASYSWLDAKDPTIAVPGSPPVWRARALPYAVARDTGTAYVDQNAARLASSPLLALVAAVAHHAPAFPLPAVDFVTDRNGLRKLWRWVSADAGAGTFRIDVELVGARTVLMERWEVERTQAAGPGYERSFERASTTPAAGCDRATGHHRILTYDLGGLKMLVRFKADACLPTETKSGATGAAVDPVDELTYGLKKLDVKKLCRTTTVPTSKSGSKEATVDPKDELTPGLEKLNVAKASDTTTVPTFGGVALTILNRGTLVPQSSLVELKTRSVKTVNRFDWDDAYPQLLLSQTPNMFVCVHQRGNFQEVQKKVLAELGTEVVATKAQESLRRLSKVLGEIRDIVREEGKGARLSLVCRDGGELGVYERLGGEERFLPDEILKKFE